MESGARTLVLGWAPTAIGYSLQGSCKYGFYELFKQLYSEALGQERTYQHRTELYLAAAATAEFLADIALSPLEACKVRMQTAPLWMFPTTLREAAPRILREEGLHGFYKSLVPLWCRQVPYSMIKFTCFERSLEELYHEVVLRPRDECSKSEQLGVTFTAGFTAGVLCAVVSQPADTIVSHINQAKGSNLAEAVRALGFTVISSFVCFSEIYLYSEGSWRGLGTRIIMIGTLTGLQGLIYDSVKVQLRLPRPPPLQMPETLRAKLGGDQQ